jgi:hypothetical protein
MPRNSQRTRCQVPGCRNWAMRGHSHCHPHHDSELGPHGASECWHPRRSAACSGPPWTWPLMAHIPHIESWEKRNGKTITGTARLRAGSSRLRSAQSPALAVALEPEPCPGDRVSRPRVRSQRRPAGTSSPTHSRRASGSPSRPRNPGARASPALTFFLSLRSARIGAIKRTNRSAGPTAAACRGALLDHRESQVAHDALDELVEREPLLYGVD